MTLSIRTLLLLTVICLYSCKKNEQSKPADQTSIPAAKSMEVIKGNNQFGYAGRALDTIIIKVSLENPSDTSKYIYNYKLSTLNNVFTVLGHSSNNGIIYFKALWYPGADEVSPVVTFYYYAAGCSIAQRDLGSCKSLNFLKVNATIRKPWQKVYEDKSGNGTYFLDLHFTNKTDGLAIGYYSGLVRTADGGQTWIKGPPIANKDMQMLSFSGPDTGLMVVTNNIAYFTYDGGKTYQQTSETPPLIGDRSSASYLMQSRNVIYTVGWRGQIAKTIDGGLKWTIFPGFSFQNNLLCIISKGNDTLYACGELGKIVNTTDAGKNWHEQSLQSTDNLNTLCFVTNTFGFIGGQKGDIIRTTDGGETWATIKTGIKSSIIEIRFFNLQHGFAVSNSGEIEETNDGGFTWLIRNTDNYGASDLTKVVIKDEHTIFGVSRMAIYNYNLDQK
jgi:photosystem II stability/assembly factor-like uncharacterized protein